MRIHSISRRTAVTLGAAALVAALGAPAALAADGDCDPLVSHTPTGSEGDTGAVAITSQTLSSAAGWERVGWEAARDTTVTAVAVVREEATEHRTDGDLSTGTAEQVLELRFCGTVDGDEEPADEQPADEREAEVERVVASEPADEPADPEPANEPDEAPADDAAAEPAPAAEATEGDEAAEVEPEPVAAPPARADDDAPDDPARVEEADDAGTADAEVAQATPATAPQPTAPVTGTLVALLTGLAALAGVRWRRTREGRR